ncbi:YeiH family protein [Acanthopleuribacter pedis]|uniref:Putative sulfate exporter family transporter n=1 Tax=Acanthopleuribacter pedis TaxID=442870 RepID=A0A8J7U4Z7_9BACT|nr:putative sulfate exporter family transporter [Acanthopleuribacter pedis]MBO1320309.1 putative sulfate exporter family transporter [Acanthopleuribacter pedis]
MSNEGTGIRATLPGLGLVVGIAVLIRGVHGILPDAVATVLGEAVLGMAVGLALGNFLTLPATLEPGIRTAFGTVLKLSIILLGARLSLQQIGQIGGDVLMLIIGLILTALALTWLLSRWAGISPKLGLLIGVGTSICGNTAITCTAPVIAARDEEVSFAIATNTLFGTLAVFCYPLLGHMLHLSEPFFGVWAGTAVNDTSQVVAAGFSYGTVAGELATTVKLTRNALMAFVIVAIGLLVNGGGATSPCGKVSLLAKFRSAVPGFVIGFLVMTLANTLGFFDLLSDQLGRNVVGDFTWVAKFLILNALIGVGLNTRFDKLKCLGWKPLVIGCAASLVSAVASFSFIRWVLHL